MTKKEFERWFIEQEMNHLDYDKPKPFKYLTSDKVLDLRFVKQEDIKDVINDIKTNHDEIGLSIQESKNITAKVIAKYLDKINLDFAGVIDNQGNYYIVGLDKHYIAFNCK